MKKLNITKEGFLFDTEQTESEIQEGFTDCALYINGVYVSSGGYFETVEEAGQYDKSHDCVIVKFSDFDEPKEVFTEYRVNSVGFKEIKNFLIENHKRFCSDQLTEEALNAYAQEIEQSINNGNPPAFEIPAHESRFGRAQVFRVSDAGLYSEEVSYS